MITIDYSSLKGILLSGITIKSVEMIGELKKDAIIKEK